MDAMIMMLSKMAGFSPDELKKMATDFQQGFLELAAAVGECRDNTRAISAKQDLIMEKLGVENGQRKLDGNGSDGIDASADAGTGE